MGCKSSSTKMYVSCCHDSNIYPCFVHDRLVYGIATPTSFLKTDKPVIKSIKPTLWGTIDDSAMTNRKYDRYECKADFVFPFAQLHVSMTENCLAFLFAQCARTSSLHWSTVINLLVHYFGILFDCRFGHSKQLLWNKTIITDNYLLWQTHVTIYYLQNEWLEMAAAKWT